MPDIFEDMEKPFLPMLISNWIFGIGIIEFPIRKPRKIFSFIYTTIILSSYLYLSYVSYSSYALTKLALMSPITTTMFYYVNIFVTISVLVAGWFQSKGLHKCMLIAALTNKLLQKIGINKSHSKILKNELIRFLTLFAYIIAVISTNCGITFYHRELTAKQIIAIFVQNFPIIMVFIADSSFMNILGYAYYKFDSLNEMLQNLLSSSEDVPLYREIAKEATTKNVRSRDTPNSEERDYTFVIKTGRKIHSQLIKLCREANATYGFHTLISISVAFIMIIINLFNVYLSLNSSLDIDTKIREIVRNLNWFLYFWIKTSTNTRFYTTVCSSANKIGDIICELYDEHSINEKTKAEIRRFNVNLVQNKLKLTARGLIDVDMTLMPTMIGAVLTYIIIILQFQTIVYEPSVSADYDYFWPASIIFGSKAKL